MIDPQDRALLVRDKYDGREDADIAADCARLAAGEPLAYVIGWVPFLGLRIGLDSRPLIPRPETEWWTQELCAHLEERFGDRPFRLLDLCAGSGAIGLAVLAKLPHAQVSFGELELPHAQQIRENLSLNGIDAARADVRVSDLFAAFPGERFDVIATNPPYIPAARALDPSVTLYEPQEALFSGDDGLDLIRRIAIEVPQHLSASGELWLEADIENIDRARELILEGSARDARIRTDLYGRPRVVVGYYA